MIQQKGFRKIMFQPQNSGKKIFNQHLYYKSPTSFREISESKEKQRPMFGKLKKKREEQIQISSAKKSSNIFSNLLKSRSPSTNKKMSFLDETKNSTNQNSVITNKSSIIKEANKQNKKPKGLKFKCFPHKKLNKIQNNGPLQFKEVLSAKKQPLTSRTRDQGPVIGSNKKKLKLNVETFQSHEKSSRDFGFQNVVLNHQQLFLNTDRINLDSSFSSSVQNSVVRSQSSLMLDMSPTLK